MQLSLYSDYALRILMALAVSGQRLTIDEIARRYGVSRHHLAKVAQDLQAQGLVETVRGRGGGLQLSQSPREICVGDVVRRLERLDSFVGCFALPDGGCAVNGVCGLKPALAGALEAFLAHLDGYRLSDLVLDRSPFRTRLDFPDEPVPA